MLEEINIYNCEFNRIKEKIKNSPLDKFMNKSPAPEGGSQLINDSAQRQPQSEV